MDTSETPQSPSLVQQEQPSLSKDANLPEAGAQTKCKKKKKNSGKKTPLVDTVSQQEPAKAEGSQGGEDVELVSVSEFLQNVSSRETNHVLIYHLTDFQGAEEQLNRQLDWCIEQLELGMKSLKATPKQSIHLSALNSIFFRLH